MQSNFNEKQKEAISLGFGPAMILAGPGSGKTKTLLHRIEYLTNELNISPQHILVITFTKAAALELKERANKILKFSKESPFYGTFHSYFYSVLKQFYEYLLGRSGRIICHFFRLAPKQISLLATCEQVRSAHKTDFLLPNRYSSLFPTRY